MRIWTTVIGQRLDDAENTRSMILCDHLMRRGHDVTMWTSAWDHVRKKWRDEWLDAGKGPMRRGDGLEIRFMKGCGYKSNTSPVRLVDHWLAARDFTRQAQSLPPPDAIVASCPDHLTASAAVAYGRSVGAATIVDVRDKWPDVLFDLMRGSPLKQAVARTGLFFESRRISRALKDADAIVAMMESMLDWGLAKAGRARGPQDEIYFLTTAPKNFDVERSPLPDGHPINAALEATRGRTVFGYVGIFNRTQHPSILLDALDILDQQGLNDPSRMAFLIGGTGLDAESIAARAATKPNVHYVGWVKPPEMAALLGGADVGLLLLTISSEAFNNKTFSYLASGLPIINSAIGDLATLIDRNDAGVNIPAADPAALAKAILDLVDHPERVEAMKKSVRELFDANFSRERTYNAYAEHVERLAASRRKS